MTISPKIKPFIDLYVSQPPGPLIRDASGEAFTLRRFTETVFYPVLDAAGIDNPVITGPTGDTRHKYTPHSCRHTFATLLKRVSDGSTKDKLDLIGHTSEKMMIYYQDADWDDLRRVTDSL